MNYLRYGLEKRNLKGLGKVLAGLFAVLAVGASFGGGNMFQANQSFEQLSGQFPALQGNGLWFGIIGHGKGGADHGIHLYHGLLGGDHHQYREHRACLFGHL
jgi:hypothetical protein